MAALINFSWYRSGSAGAGNTAPNDQKLPTTTGQQRPAKPEAERRYNRLNPIRVASTGTGASRSGQPTGTMASSARNTAARVKGRGGLHRTHIDQQLAKRHRHQHDKRYRSPESAPSAVAWLLSQLSIFTGPKIIPGKENAKPAETASRPAFQSKKWR